MPGVTPEDMFRNDGSPVEVAIACRSCGHRSTETCKWVLINERAGRALKPNDAIVLSHLVTCARCGAVDDYDISASTMARLLALSQQEAMAGRILLGEARLWDGTIFTRPSLGLAHLQRLCAERPHEAEAQRRLGNFCERYNLSELAVAAWQRAVELDPTEFDAAHSLAVWFWRHTDATDQAVRFLIVAVRNYVPRCKLEDMAHRFAPVLAEILLEIASSAQGEFNLLALWSGGEMRDATVVNLSSASLRLVRDPSLLIAFLERRDLISLTLTNEPIVDQPTRLQLLLSGPALPTRTAPRRPGKVGRKLPWRPPPIPDRNTPCPCQSGKKYKHCCGR